MVEYLKIPKAKIELLLRNDKKLKKQIEAATKTKIHTDKELNEVEISETSESDPLMLWTARDIVKALGRGFEPEVAFRLVEDNADLRILEIKEHIGKSKKAAIRIKGRIIGTDGKAKKKIEDLTNTNISVYGKTVAIIGPSVGVDAAISAIEMLIEGAMHGTVFKSLKRAMSKKAHKL